MMLFSLLLVTYFPFAQAGAPVAKSSDAIIELSRENAQLRELVLIHYKDGVEQMIVNTNRFLPKSLEVGMFERKSSLLFSLAKTLKGTPKSVGPSNGPHGWKVRVFSEELPDGDPRIDQAVQGVQQELSRSSSGWTALDTMTAKIEVPSAVFTFQKNGKVYRTEKQPMFDACHAIEGQLACKGSYGYVFLPKRAPAKK